MHHFKTNLINTFQFFYLHRILQFRITILIALWQIFLTIRETQLKRNVASGTVSKYGLFCSSDMNLQTLLTKHFKTFDIHLPVYYSPELYADRIKAYIAGFNRRAERFLEANAKFIRGNPELCLQKFIL